MERLAARLLELAFTEGDDAFEVPVIAVQGRGMERWLAQYCANATGVFAGVRITRVRGFVELVCDAMLGDGTATTRLDAATLPFRIAKHLDAVIASEDGSAFAAYLEGADGDRRMQLVERLAETFDRYFVHRPKLVREWIDGRSDPDPIVRGQAALLRRVVADAPGYEGRRVADAITRLDRATPLLTSSIPRKTFLFGVGTLAPLYLDLLRSVSAVSDVHLFVLTPGETWLSDLGRDETARGEIGSMIRGFGKIATEFQDLLEGVEGHDSEYLGGDWAEPTTMLDVLRHDLCTLTQRGEGPGREPRVSIDDADRSFVVHSCHSPTRELEVLHELLVDRLEADPTLAPSDIAVLTADVERYAPLVHSVFGRERDAARRIPYHVADRGVRASLGFVDAFFATLEAIDARTTLPLVGDLLDRDPIRARFGLERADVEFVLRLLRESGARWGLSADDRALEGQPRFEEHTFERALDRLALGFVVPSGADPFHGVAPAMSAVGKDVEALEGLFGFFEALERIRAARADERSVEAHVAFARKVLDAFLDRSDRFEEEAQLVERALGAMLVRSEASGFDGSIATASFVRLLAAELDEGDVGGFLNGGVTFCRQVPMRAIPFRIICLLGLDDGSFPRNVESPRFDLVANAPMKGDRTPRDDDRQAFLETILSARDELHLFHVGRDVATNTERAVSTVVSRTLDVLERALVRPGERSIRELAFVEHPLHGFDPAYFVAGARARGLVSADPVAFRSAVATIGPKVAPEGSFSIGVDADAVESIRFDELLRFVLRPDADFLERVLGIPRVEDPTTLPDRELLETTGLDRYELVERSLGLIRKGLDEASVASRLRAEGRLPPGSAGAAAARRAHAIAFALLERASGRIERPPVDLRIDLDGRMLVGALTGATDHGLLRVVASKVNARNRFGVFVESLALALADSPGVAKRGTLIARPSKSDSIELVEEVSFDAPDAPAAREALGALVDAYVASRVSPVPIDPELLEAYSKVRLRTNGSEASAMDAAIARFAASFDERSDYGDAARRQLFGPAFAGGARDRSREFVDRRFRTIAEDVYLPFRRRLKEGA